MKKSGLQSGSYIFVLGQAGVRGNELADSLASLVHVTQVIREKAEQNVQGQRRIYVRVMIAQSRR